MDTTDSSNIKSILCVALSLKEITSAKAGHFRQRIINSNFEAIFCTFAFDEELNCIVVTGTSLQNVKVPNFNYNVLTNHNFSEKSDCSNRKKRRRISCKSF